jgi:hypothetical protein
VAVNNVYIVDTVKVKNTDVENIFVRIKMENRQALTVGAAYRPPSSGTDYMDRLCDNFSDIQQRFSNDTIWIGGDLNLPDINWQSGQVEGRQYPPAISNSFIDQIHRT